MLSAGTGYKTRDSSMSFLQAKLALLFYTVQYTHSFYFKPYSHWHCNSNLGDCVIARE